MSTFIVSLQTTTPVVIGKWMTLDGILDGILEAEELPPKRRVVPLVSWDGVDKHVDLDTEAIQQRGLVHMASAMRVKGTTVKTDPTGELYFETTRPFTTQITLRGGHSPVRDFHDERFPFVNGRGGEATKFETGRMESKAWTTSRLTLNPCRLEWLAQGDPEAVVDILCRADGIGAKRSSGMGRFDLHSVEIELLEGVSDLAGVLDEDGDFVHRPVPLRMLPEGPRGRAAMQTCRNPYWDRSGVEAAGVPLARHHDGLLTI